jgi:mRNA interferase RelE/StbE
VKYKIKFAKPAEDQLVSLPKSEISKISKRIDKLADNPFPPKCDKLEGSDDIYRVRQGDYRILYTVFEKNLVVLVLKIGHRREVYRK